MPSISTLGSTILPLLTLPLLHTRPALGAEYTTTNTSNLHDNSRSCSCYVVDTGEDSQTPAYFKYYRFFDFRNLADKPGQYAASPPTIENSQDDGNEPVTDDIFTTDAWTTDWAIMNWSRPATDEFPTRMVNSPANVYISQSSEPHASSDEKKQTYITLRTTRLDDFQSGAEIESMQKNIFYCSMRMRARVVGAKGAVAGFFTFLDDINESDIEILTSDPRDTIRYTNQPALDDEGNEVPEASQEVGSLPAWDEWQDHRIDWISGESYWYLNGKQVARTTYSVPRRPSYVTLNMWSDGGEWSGDMEVGESAEFQVQWVEMAFNTSGPVEGPVVDYGDDREEKRGLGLWKREEKGCKKVCKVDGVEEMGKPESVGPAMGLELQRWLLVLAGAAAVFVAL